MLLHDVKKNYGSCNITVLESRTVFLHDINQDFFLTVGCWKTKCTRVIKR